MCSIKNISFAFELFQQQRYSEVIELAEDFLFNCPETKIIQRNIKEKDICRCIKYGIDAYRLMGNFEDVEEFFLKIQTVYRKTESQSIQIEILIQKAKLLRDYGDYSSAIDLLKYLISIIKHDNRLKSIFGLRILNLLGASYSRHSNYIGAINAYMRVHNLAKAKSNYKYVIFSLNNLADIFFLLGDLSTSQLYAERALNLIYDSESGNNYAKAAILSNLAQIHIAKGNYDIARRLLKEMEILNSQNNALEGFRIFLEFTLAIKNKHLNLAEYNLNLITEDYSLLGIAKVYFYDLYANSLFYFTKGLYKKAKKYIERYYNFSRDKDDFQTVKAIILYIEILLHHYYRTNDSELLDKCQELFEESQPLVEVRFFPHQVQLMVLKCRVGIQEGKPIQLLFEYLRYAEKIAYSLDLHEEIISIKKLQENLQKHSIALQEYKQLEIKHKQPLEFKNYLSNISEVLQI